MDNQPSIYNWIKSQEARYEADEIQVGDNWRFNMRSHVQMIFHLMNSQFFTGENNWLRAFKNVMEPMVELANWMEDIEVKDILFFIESANGRVLSFLIKKYHEEVFVRKHNLDEMIDEITESDNTYGGVLVQKTNEPKPQIIELNTIAFCDQTDITGGPIGFKMHFSPDKLRGMSKLGWGEESNGATISLEELVTLASAEKQPYGSKNTKNNDVTGKTIEVYIVRGNLPEHYLKDNDNMELYYNQLQIIAFYTDKKGKKTGVTLYRKKEKEGKLKFFTSKKITGRGLGRGVGEQMLHPQIWTSFLSIHKMSLIEAASKIVPYTDDDSYVTKNNLQDVENLEIQKIAEGRTFGIVPTVGLNNINVITQAVDEWFQQAQLLGNAQDPLLGKEPNSGTTFRGQERTVAQGRGPHDRRRGKRAKFIEEIYRSPGWIIDQMVSEITANGAEFMATLSSEELAWVSEQLAENYVNDQTVEAVIAGKRPTNEEKDLLKQVFKENFAKQGNKMLIKILKDEFKDIEVKIGINIAGKQKNLADLSDKIVSIVQFGLTNPIPPSMQKPFNDILEMSGISQADFQTLISAPVMAQQPGQPSPLQLNPAANEQV